MTPKSTLLRLAIPLSPGAIGRESLPTQPMTASRVSASPAAPEATLSSAPRKARSVATMLGSRYVEKVKRRSRPLAEADAP